MPISHLPYNLDELNALSDQEKLDAIRASGNNIPDYKSLKTQGKIKDFTITFAQEGYAHIVIKPT